MTKIGLFFLTFVVECVSIASGDQYSDMLPVPAYWNPIYAERLSFKDTMDSSNFRYRWTRLGGDYLSLGRLAVPYANGQMMSNDYMDSSNFRAEMFIQTTDPLARPNVSKFVLAFSANISNIGYTSYISPYGVDAAKVNYLGLMVGVIFPQDDKTLVTFARLAHQHGPNSSFDRVCSRGNIRADETRKGLRIVVQMVDEKLTVAIWPQGRPYPQLCISDWPLTGFQQMFIDSPLPMTLQVTGINRVEDHPMDIENNKVLIRELNFWHLEPSATPGPVPAGQPDTAILPIVSPADGPQLTQVYLDRLSFVSPNGFEAWKDSTSTPITNLNLFSAVSSRILSSETVPMNATSGWRLEITFLATGVTDKDWYFDTFVGDKASPQGVTIRQMLTTNPDKWEQQYCLAPTKSSTCNPQPASNLQVCGKGCALNPELFKTETTMIVQVSANKISVAFRGLGWSEACLNFAEFNTGGAFVDWTFGETSAVAFLAPAATLSGQAGNKPSVTLQSVRFFALTASEPLTPPTTPGPTLLPGQTRAPPLFTRSPLDTSEPLLQNPQLGLPTDGTKITDPNLLLQLLIGNIPLESSETEIRVSDILRFCNDFAPDRLAPPGGPSKIRQAFAVTRLLDLNNVEQSIAVQGMLLTYWKVETCPKGSFDLVSKRSNERIFVPSIDAVWTPQYRFVSSADSNVYLRGDVFGDDFVANMENNPANVDNKTFNFYWIREGLYESVCYLDLEKFPYDTQTCTFSFALLRSTNLVEFSADDMIFYWPDDIAGAEWIWWEQFTKVTRQPYKGALISVAHYTVTLKRVPDFYVNNLALPSLVLSLLEVVSFAMPPLSTDRASFAITIMLSLTVAQTAVLEQIPKTTQRILLSDYINCLFWFCAAVTAYHLVACLMANIIKKAVMRGRVTLTRVIDGGFFLATAVVFAGINAYFWLATK